MSLASSFRWLIALGAVLVASQSAAAQAAAEHPRVMPARGYVDGEDIVHTAERFLGVPYRWGGNGPKAFDCSGLVRYVFGQYGIELPRTAHEQVALGDAPPPGDLRPGDLLFFYGGKGAQHVAIYVGGDSIIHASSSRRRVRFDRLSGSRSRPTWFGRRLIAVRRLLPVDVVFMLPAAPDTAAAHHAVDETGAAGAVHRPVP